MSSGLRLGRVATELGIVVVGVIIALAADSWREGLSEKRLESQYVERLLTAVGSLQLQGRDPYEYLTTLMQAHTARQPLPSLLPQPSEV